MRRRRVSVCNGTEVQGESWYYALLLVQLYLCQNKEQIYAIFQRIFYIPHNIDMEEDTFDYAATK